ncbi:MAG: DeoR/GlpR family DNA-binding transcription regulator [Lachnospiraceae bacterium]|nr:DeoR/GlpR family DNA-binding transcription regulator [Lachnospiraceae bacterium]
MKLSNSRRLQSIADLLQEKGFVKARELSALYEVSMETIRKDLMYLEEKGVAKKEYGGASLSLMGVEKGLEFRKIHDEGKQEIARCAAELLKEYHSLILDSGSTCQACVPYINLISSMNIVTNSLDACKQLNGNQHQVFLLPGRKREKNGSVIGNWTEKYLKSIHVDICLMGTSGLLECEGTTAHSYEELSTKQYMIRQSDMVFVLADSSKFQEKGIHTVEGWNMIDGIITDRRISQKVYTKYSKKVPIYIAGEDKI